VKNIIIFAAIIFLCQCKKTPENHYPNENIVMDNAQATLYFHTVFREAENAWAFIDSMDYRDSTYYKESNKSTSYIKYTFKESEKPESEKTVTVDYYAWVTNQFLLEGTITVKFGIDSYRTVGSTASVYLTDFSINQQFVEASSTIKFNKTVDGKDTYTYTLRDGAAIHEQGYSAMPVLITCAIGNGQYERIEGNETLTQKDDVWVYSGVMTGMLRNDPNLKYTNTIVDSYSDNGDVKDRRVYYSMDCKFAEQGLSQITFLKRPLIVFEYGCNGYNFFTVTHFD